MSKILVGVCAVSFALNAGISRADCRPAYQAEIQKRQERIAHFKRVKHRAVLYTFIGVGVPVGVAGGLLFLGITDGATAPAAALSGLAFGAIAGGAAAGAVYLPLEAIQLVMQYKEGAYIHANALIDEAARFDRQGKELNQLLGKIRHSHPEMDQDDLIGVLNEANARDAFCDGTVSGSAKNKLAKPGEIKKYVKSLHRHLS